MNFETSTHFKRWIFSIESLESNRQNTREKYLSKAKVPSSVPTQDTLISLHDETGLLRHYQSKLCTVCSNLKLPRKVLNTSVNYLKRFYINNSVLEYDPQQMTLVCLYVACKVEDCYVSAAELGRLGGIPAEGLLKAELTLIQGIQFDLQIHSLYRASDGCIIDFMEWVTRNKSREEKEDENIKSKLKVHVYRLVDSLLLSDAPLIYTPGFIALLALKRGLISLKKSDDNGDGALAAFVSDTDIFEEYLKQHVDKENAFESIVNDIEIRFLNGDGEHNNNIDYEQVVEIDRKLKSFRKLVGVKKKSKNVM